VTPGRIAVVAAVGTAVVVAPPSGSARRVTVPRCVTAQLALRLTSYEAQMTGEHGSMFALRNRGRAACSLLGYPRVRLFDGRGVLPFRYGYGTGSYLPRLRPRRVLLRPGRSAFVLVVKYRCDRGGTRSASRIELTPPGGRFALTGRRLARRLGDYEYCRGGPGDPGNLLQISPVSPSAQALAGG
jgi:Domain of unknown function (DUF4232)